jgi:hypothetical protein
MRRAAQRAQLGQASFKRLDQRCRRYWSSDSVAYDMLVVPPTSSLEFDARNVDRLHFVVPLREDVTALAPVDLADLPALLD